MNFNKKITGYFQPEAPVIRRALSMAIAVFVAVLIDRYYSVLQEFWVPLIAILVVYMTVQMNFRQSLQRVLVIVGTVFCASSLSGWMDQPVLTDVIVVAIFAIGYGFHHTSLTKGHTVSIPLLIAVVVLMVLIPFPSSSTLFPRMHDVVLGGIVGVVAGLLIFPAQPDADFRKGVIPVLQAYNDYLLAIMELLFRLPKAELVAQQAKYRVELVLQVQQEFFPEWVYDAGFNPALQQGHRHFLIKIEQLGQVLFAMHQIARHAIDAKLLEEFRESIQHYVEQARGLMVLFVARLNLEKIDKPMTDFSEEIVTLEKTYRNVIQVPLELLDTSQDYIDLAALIFDLKNCQNILLRIAEALR
jgi:uncharacterized membrane protein YccC